MLGARYVIYKVLAERLGEAVRQVFPDKPKDELKIIDVGAGTGLVGEELHKLGYSDLHALDISQEMLNEAKKKNVYNKLICASLSDQGIPDVETGEFDALICCGTLLMAHVRPSAFVEMIRMVKIGKFLLGTDAFWANCVKVGKSRKHIRFLQLPYVSNISTEVTGRTRQNHFICNELPLNTTCHRV